MASVIERLVADAPQFDFFQAVSLLEELSDTLDGLKDPITAGRIRFSADTGLEFPASDVARIRPSERAITVFSKFMGLVGVASPLPVYFAEYAAVHEDKAGALMDFLGIFNHRLYALFYRAWKKYRFIKSISPDFNDPFTKRIAALAGVGISGRITPHMARMIAYAGLRAGKNRNAQGLAAMLTDYFSGVPVAIKPWIPRWAQLSNPTRLNGLAQLGVNAISGTSILDMSGKFRVSIGPLLRDNYESFLPGTENAKLAWELVELFCTDPLEFELEIKMQSTELTPVELGRNNAALGRTSSLGKSSGKFMGTESVIIDERSRKKTPH